MDSKTRSPSNMSASACGPRGILAVRNCYDVASGCCGVASGCCGVASGCCGVASGCCVVASWTGPTTTTLV